jgi:hypothetical protein
MWIIFLPRSPLSSFIVNCILAASVPTQQNYHGQNDCNEFVDTMTENDSSGVSRGALISHELEHNERPPVISTSNGSNEFQNDAGDTSARLPILPLRFAPEYCPRTWTLLNSSLTLSGYILIRDMVFSLKQAKELPFARAFHLVWEFTTCFFWTLEVCLSASYQYYHLDCDSLAWYTRLEIVVAVYFTITTLLDLIQWNIMDEPVSMLEIYEVALDTTFYVYLTLRSFQKAFPEVSCDHIVCSHDMDELWTNPFEQPENGCEGKLQETINDEDEEAAYAKFGNDTNER